MIFFNMISRILIASWLLLASFIGVCRCQDLVPNGDFEKANICTEQLSQCSPAAWFNSLKYGGYGYNHPPMGGASGYGYIHPPTVGASGRDYLILVAAAMPKDRRDYWETMLLCRLEPGQLYHISLSVAADKIGPNLNDIGFYFTHNFIFSLHDSLFQPDAGVVGFKDAKVHRLSNGWFSVQKDFRPTTSAQFLIIGNFSRKTNAEIIGTRRPQDSVVRIFVDDVSILKDGGEPCPRMNKIRDSLYAIRRRHPKDAPATVKAEASNYIASIKPDTIRLGNLLFEFGKSEFKDPISLERYRSVLSNNTVKRLEIVGYADDAGSKEYNIQLSLDRAREVAGIITKMFGIPASSMRIKGKGISTESMDKSLNRRVEIYLYH
jgi:outer membrane protein OmpA-like peptidoglycan-associated protein